MNMVLHHVHRTLWKYWHGSQWSSLCEIYNRTNAVSCCRVLPPTSSQRKRAALVSSHWSRQHTPHTKPRTWFLNITTQAWGWLQFRLAIVLMDRVSDDMTLKSCVFVIENKEVISQLSSHWQDLSKSPARFYAKMCFNRTHLPAHMHRKSLWNRTQTSDSQECIKFEMKWRVLYGSRSPPACPVFTSVVLVFTAGQRRMLTS